MDREQELLWQGQNEANNKLSTAIALQMRALNALAEYLGIDVGTSVALAEVEELLRGNGDVQT